MGGIWYMPTSQWSGNSNGEGNSLHYDINNAPVTTYEGNFGSQKYGLNAGIRVGNNSNAVGKIDQFMGYVGYDGFYLRAQSSDLFGTANLQCGSLSCQAQSSYAINTVYQNFQLVHSIGGNYENFWGIGYTTLALPQLYGIQSNSDFRQFTPFSIADPNSRFKIYSAFFGFDTLNWTSIAENNGFGFWLYTQDGIGFGSQSVSSSIQSSIESQAGGETMPSSLVTSMGDFSLTLGVKWEKQLPKYNMSIGSGLGFNVHAMLYDGGWNTFSTGNTASVKATAITFLVGFGPEFKLVARM